MTKYKYRNTICFCIYNFFQMQDPLLVLTPLIALTFKGFLLYSIQLLSLQKSSFYIYYKCKNDIFLTPLFLLYLLACSLL